MTTKPTVRFYPWATWADDLSPNGKPVHICPECGLHVEEPNLKGGRVYKHYDQAHRTSEVTA